MITLSERQQRVYDTLVDLYGEDAVNFFTNVFGMQLCDDDDVYQELVDMGVLDEEEDLYEEDEYDEENYFDD